MGSLQAVDESGRPKDKIPDQYSSGELKELLAKVNCLATEPQSFLKTDCLESLG